MFKRLLAIALCAIFNAGLAWAAEESKAPQLYPRDQLKKWDREKVAGGEGTLYGEFPIPAKTPQRTGPSRK